MSKDDINNLVCEIIELFNHNSINKWYRIFFNSMIYDSVEGLTNADKYTCQCGGSNNIFDYSNKADPTMLNMIIGEYAYDIFRYDYFDSEEEKEEYAHHKNIYDEFRCLLNKYNLYYKLDNHNVVLTYCKD